MSAHQHCNCGARAFGFVDAILLALSMLHTGGDRVVPVPLSHSGELTWGRLQAYGSASTHDEIAFTVLGADGNYHAHRLLLHWYDPTAPRA